MTLGDISVCHLMWKVSHNEMFEHNLILQAIASKYPKLTAFEIHMRGIFKEFLDANKLPF